MSDVARIVVPGYCECGERFQTTGEGFYTTAHFNSRGEIIYAVCAHGKIVIDRRDEQGRPP